ncbi:PDZ domain-containing protein [Prosthecobacter sp. SYSU 5D2]|uniref:S1C family serine protease n=1 Tax=Prosthecobacter sp. SYSU 5D2 TaxID=3134134 RepID=UPI0031FE7195
MKPIHAALIAMAGLLALLNSPVHAQERPEAAPPPASQENEPAREKAAPDNRRNTDLTPPSRRLSPPPRDRTRSPRPGAESPTAYIGVMTSALPRDLRSHFGLPEGFGLLVQEVMPDTPASAAGIQANDVLIRFEDQKLVNMEQLQTLVRSKKKDDQVPMTLLSNGKEKQVTVKIDERMMPAMEGDMRRDSGPFPPFFGSQRGSPDIMREWRDSLEKYQRQMQEYEERMRELARDWSRDNGFDSRPMPPSRNGPDRRDGFSFRDNARGREPERPSRQNRENANVTRSDDSGVYSLRQEDGRTVFTAKPKDAGEQKWEVNSEEDRRSLPPLMQEKLRQLEAIRDGEMPLVPDAEKPSTKGEGAI